jgi:hypothetical protein
MERAMGIEPTSEAWERFDESLFQLCSDVIKQL